MNFGSTPGSNPLTPVLRPESAPFFANPDDVDPWSVGENTATSALRFNTRFDLLGISQTDETDVSESIDPNISIEKIYYRTKNGKVHELSVANRPFTHFVFDVLGDFRTLQLNFTTEVSKLGMPTTAFGKRWKKFLIWTGYNSFAIVKINGSVNLQYGTTEVNAVSSDADTQVIGYTLNAQRVNLNRQGRCPVMG
jgi:hypothetical protein